MTLTVLMLFSSLGLIMIDVNDTVRNSSIVVDGDRFIEVIKEENMSAWIHGHVHTDHALSDTAVERWGTKFIDDGSIFEEEEVESLLFIFENGSENVTVKSRDHLAREWNGLENKFSFKLDYPFQWNSEKLRVWVYSDTQPLTDDDWKNLKLAVDDTNANMGDLDMAIMPGDVVDHGSTEDYKKYRNYIENSKIPWENFYHLAGNHDFNPMLHGDLNNYQDIIDNKLRYTLCRGNILFVFMSDNRPGVPGEIYDGTFHWWENLVETHQDNNVITVVHHSLKGTTRGGDPTGLMGNSLQTALIIVGLAIILSIGGAVAFEAS